MITAKFVLCLQISLLFVENIRFASFTKDTDCVQKNLYRYIFNIKQKIW